MNTALAAVVGVVALLVVGALLLLILLLLSRVEVRPRPRRFRSVPRREVTPAQVAADPLLADIAKMLSYHHLHVAWVNGHEFRQLTTEQKELWADLIDADHVNDPSGSDPDEEPWLVERWWREDYTGPLPERSTRRDRFGAR